MYHILYSVILLFHLFLFSLSSPNIASNSCLTSTTFTISSGSQSLSFYLFLCVYKIVEVHSTEQGHTVHVVYRDCQKPIISPTLPAMMSFKPSTLKTCLW